MTSAEVLSITEFEYDTPCENLLDAACGRSAEYMIWVRHSHGGCGGLTVPSCTACKAKSEAWWADTLRGTGLSCGLCGMSVSGQLSDHFRAIRL